MGVIVDRPGADGAEFGRADADRASVAQARSGPIVVERWFRAMNTDVHVVIVGGGGHGEGDGVGGERLLDHAEKLISDREARWSRFLPDSELTLINDSPGRPVIVSPETFRIVAKAIEAWEETDGAFDPTVGTSMRSAGYDRSFNRLSSPPVTTASVMVSVIPVIPVMVSAPVSGGYMAAPTPQQIELHDVASAITVPVGISLDLGGIAKGEAADVVVAELLAEGVAGCCVNIGGDLRAEGVAPDGDGWTVTLDCPGSDEQRAVAIAGGAVCTSTTLKRRWTSANGAEHHLRDPRTGASLDTGVISMSVLAARADQAEVLTKAAMAAGPDGAEEVVTARGATGLMVDSTGSLHVFAGFERFALGGTRAPSLPTVGSNRYSERSVDIKGVE